MDQQFLDFFEVAINAQKQSIEEAWVLWEKCPAQEAWEGGFKEFLIVYLDDQVEEMYKKAGIEYPKK